MAVIDDENIADGRVICSLLFIVQELGDGACGINDGRTVSQLLGFKYLPHVLGGLPRD